MVGGPSDRDTLRRKGGNAGELKEQEMKLEKGKYEYVLGKGGEKGGDGIDVLSTIVGSILNIIKNGNINNIAENLNNIIKNATETGTGKQGNSSSFIDNSIVKINVEGGKGGSVLNGYSYIENKLGDMISEENKDEIEDNINNLNFSIFDNTIKTTLKATMEIIYNTSIYTAKGEVKITLPNGQTPGKGGDFNENGTGGYLRIEYIGE